MKDTKDACGMCRQLMPSKPLQGYTFYFDVDVNDEDEAEHVEVLEGRIANLGGQISRQLSKKKAYFISGSKKKSTTPRRSGRFLKQNETRAQKPKARDVRHPLTTIDRARMMGLKIFTISKVAKWLKEIERKKIYFSPMKKVNVAEGGDALSSPMDVENGGRYSIKDGSPQSFQSLSSFKGECGQYDEEELIIPYIKVEDKKHKFEPQYLEVFSVPGLNFESKAPRTPFFKPDLNGTLDGVEKIREEGSNSPTKEENKTLSSTSKYSKSGYCDFCESFFRFRDRHIKSKKHQANIPLETFKAIDELITNCPFDDFLLSSCPDSDLIEEVGEMKTEEMIEQTKVPLQSNTVEQKKVREFLKTLEGAKQSWDVLKSPVVEVNDLQDCNAKKEDNNGFQVSNGGQIFW